MTYKEMLQEVGVYTIVDGKSTYNPFKHVVLVVIPDEKATKNKVLLGSRIHEHTLEIDKHAVRISKIADSSWNKARYIFKRENSSKYKFEFTV